MILKRKLYARILNTRGISGFQRERNYDEDMNRLGRLKTQRQLHTGVNDLNSEIRKLGKELNNGRLGKWQHID